ncbi:MAG TPA: GNAT family N-acetyltransferase [Xanthobacteraceae bacterium]|jgi:ribosomal protein S18 acetylase RimI-like enzyme
MTSFAVRSAEPRDVPDLMRLKHLLAEAENSLHALSASEADWLRDGFGVRPGFTAFVAETAGTVTAKLVIGMATCSQRVITGWNGPVLFLQDLFVEQAYRGRGVARALTARVAALACELGSPIVELTVRAENPAQHFYRRTGFLPLPQCLTYVLAGSELAALARDGKADGAQVSEQNNKSTLALAG